MRDNEDTFKLISNKNNKFIEQKKNLQLDIKVNEKKLINNKYLENLQENILHQHTINLVSFTKFPKAILNLASQKN